MVQIYEKNTKKQPLKDKIFVFIWFFADLFVPLQPLFGVIAGRKHRVACYVALERYNNQLIT